MKSKTRQAAELAERARRITRVMISQAVPGNWSVWRTNLELLGADCDRLCLLLESLVEKEVSDVEAAETGNNAAVAPSQIRPDGSGRDTSGN